jgi:hypothetical protein
MSAMKEPFGELEMIIIRVVEIILLLIAVGEVIMAKLSSAPWQVQVGVLSVIILLVGCVVYFRKK